MLAQAGERSSGTSFVLDGVDPRVKSLCDEFDVEIIDGRRYPQPGQTRAVATIRRIIDRYGEAHARIVLCVLAEGRGHSALMDEVSLWAVSDLVLACADIVETDTSAFIELFDTLPFGPYMAFANELSGTVPQRGALTGMLYLHIRKLRERTLTDRDCSAKHITKANGSEREKGRPAFLPNGHRSPEEKLAIGRRLLEVKASLPHGHFGPWVRERSGLSHSMAQQCMAMVHETRAPGRARALT